MNTLLKKIINECSCYTKYGDVASYIPELSKADRNEFGISIVTDIDAIYSAGDCNKNFTMQSIIKPLILLLALMDNGIEYIRDIVGVEATGKPFDAFNYSDQALNSEHINPMINTGAIALCTAIKGNTYKEKFSRLLELTRCLADNNTLLIDEDVYLSEKATGSKNRALAYMLKAYGMISGDVEEIVDFYFKACSIKANCIDLAKIGYVLSQKGKNPYTKQQIFNSEYARYVNAVLMNCGMYDGSGEFAINVGVPAKSGVGGGIMAVVPNRIGIGIYSPSLDKKGNSVAGIKALEYLSKELELSIF